MTTDSAEREPLISRINALDAQLWQHFDDKFRVQPQLSRQLVSFQASKSKSSYRWYKYKEAFSASLVENLLCQDGVEKGRILDPFAGSGAALFAASALGLDADGIELLPIGLQIISARLLLEQEFTPEDFSALDRWVATQPWKRTQIKRVLTTLKITDGAYPVETLEAIECYMGAWLSENERVQGVLRFALLCVLESVSYTRKDGQYLRWDHRSGRRQGARPFDKGVILPFERAITTKLSEILSDLRAVNGGAGLFPVEGKSGAIRALRGSCLDLMPQMPSHFYDAIVTSPPYCNRYDYTRTYALELALLGINSEEIVKLRQEMLSCTVENRPKSLLQMNPSWATALKAADEQELLQAVLQHLEDQKARKLINNAGIPRMVRGYFYEMACIIAESLRVLKSGAPLFMVNDNVRYAGVSISVDMILSDIAERLGFHIENILVLPGSKGNSSQQMGEHGRDPLRKCVYFWRRP